MMQFAFAKPCGCFTLLYQSKLTVSLMQKSARFAACLCDGLSFFRRLFTASLVGYGICLSLRTGHTFFVPSPVFSVSRGFVPHFEVEPRSNS
jgi:hypothetical protein